ncbi:MAG: hypothetical protein RLY86_672 [Pseudomonadota bacterium]|jgi:hypothetical protein
MTKAHPVPARSNRTRKPHEARELAVGLIIMGTSADTIRLLTDLSKAELRALERRVLGQSPFRSAAP